MIVEKVFGRAAFRNASSPRTMNKKFVMINFNLNRSVLSEFLKLKTNSKSSRENPLSVAGL
jgi:hypothetical protein